MTSRHAKRAIATFTASALVAGLASFTALDHVRHSHAASDAAFGAARASVTAELRGALESVVPPSPAIDDPQRELAQALTATSNAERRAAVGRVGAAWAAREPQAAWAAADGLPREVRERYRRAVLEEWVRLDSDAAIGALERIAPALVPRGLPLAPFVAADAERMLELGVRLPASLGRSVEAAAVRAIAATDPLGAIRLVESLPRTADRDTLLAEAASLYAEREPEAAIRWVRSLPYAPRPAAAAVAAAVADIELERAIELAIEWDVALSPDVPMAVQVGLDSARSRSVADALAAHDDVRAREMLRSLVDGWSQLDAEAAFGWIAAHAEAVETFDLRRAARAIGRSNPDTAARRIDDLPQALREEWAAQVAIWYMDHGFDRAADWLARFRGTPAYDTALAPLVERGARADPQLTARLLESAGRAMRLVGSERLATIWASREPEAAARWAAALANREVRAAAVTAAARAWAERDAGAAQRWLASLPDAPALPAGNQPR